MPRPMTQDDLTQIAAELSTHYGLVPVDELALLGVSDTVILRPGTTTEQGQILTGAACSAALGDDYEVFPMGIEYAMDDLDDALGSMDEAMDDLDEALGADDDDELGAFWQRASVRLPKRYMRIVGRYRKVMSKIQLKPTKGRQRRADRRYRRMVRIWQKMERKGVDTEDLPTPREVRDQFLSEQPARAAAPPPAPIPPAAMVQPVVYQPVAAPSGPSPAYFQDQAALEREMQAIAPRFGAEEEEEFRAALQDLDIALGDLGELVNEADSLGAFWQKASVRLPKRYMRVARRYRKVMAKIQEKPKKGRIRRAQRRLKRLRKIWAKMDAKGVDRSGLPSPRAIESEFEEEAESSAASMIDLPSVPLPSYLMPKYAGAQEALKSDLRSEAMGFCFSGMEHDYYGLRASEVEVLYSDPELGAGDEMDDAELAAEEDEESDEEILGGDSQQKLRRLAEERDQLIDELRAALGASPSMALGDLFAHARSSSDPEVRSIFAEYRAVNEAYRAESGAHGTLGLAVSRYQKMKRWARKGIKLSPKRSKKVSRWRSRWKRRLGRVKRPKRRRALRKRIALANELLSRSAQTFGASDGEGVDYGRVKPKMPGTPGEPVIVIAIRKRVTPGEVQAQAAGEYSANVIGVAPAQPGLIDVLAADLAASYRVNTGYTAPEAMAAMTEWTHPTNWIYGEEVDDLPYPMGSSAPLPPPRRAGNEVV